MISTIGKMPPKGYVPKGKKNAAVVAASEDIKKALAAPPPTGQLEAVAVPFSGPAKAVKLSYAAVPVATAASAAAEAAAKVAAEEKAARKAARAAKKVAAAEVAKPPSEAMAAKPAAAKAPASDSEDDVAGRRYRAPRPQPGKEAAQVNKFINKQPAIKPYLESFMAEQNMNELADPYLTTEDVYMPPTRKAFNRFIRDTFSEKFTLPMETLDDKSNACQKLFESAGKAGVESFLYQKFVREYIRQASPYRGMLVYHGLGSGKTCSSIAAAEALYGISDKKIIVMTPFSLRGNFLNEISFCGFSHYRLNNYWVPIPIGGSATMRLFASKVLGVGDEYVTRMMADKTDEDKYIWIPDFRPAAEREADKNSYSIYYTELDAESQARVRAQISAIVNNRFEFVNYNGVTAKTLKAWACEAAATGVSKFDNAVIVIDEIHNLIRLMQGTIIPYMKVRPGKKRKIPPEVITSERWNPPLCAKPERNYKRGYLFYRLLTDARNTKIIGLSGTPLINFPEELGILTNVLTGYIHCARISITRDNAAAAILQGILDKHPRVDFVKSNIADKNIIFTISVFPEGYMKVIEGDSFRGVRYTDDEEAQKGIVGVVEELKGNAAVPIIGVNYVSEPRLPYDGDDFRPVFIAPDGLNKSNELVLKKRLTGIVSYYKGSKEEYMPRVAKDVVVWCSMSDYMLSGYYNARYQEIEDEKGDPPDVFDTVEVKTKGKSLLTYRFKSRATCNFVFPPEITRPMPITLRMMEAEQSMRELGIIEIGERPDVAEEVERESLVEGGVAAAEEQEREDAAAVEAAREEDAATEGAEEEGEELAEPSGLAETVKAAASRFADVVLPADKAVAGVKLTYDDLLDAAMSELDKQRAKYFTPENLGTYSPKLLAMLKRIEAAPGSSLVYSQFKRVEGLGVLAIALRQAGYTEIVIKGSGEGFYFSDESRASILRGPSERRFITFTGEGTREQRALVLNIFNGHFNKLPASIKEVFEEHDAAATAAGKPTYAVTRNLHGEICRVIGITGAGAEGISLKCVRAVHIFEPYWNNVRLDQVKGRAIRICSHADLPVEERDVRIYTYIVKFSKGQLKTPAGGKASSGMSFMKYVGAEPDDEYEEGGESTATLPDILFMDDDGKTTDEFIYGVSERKQKIIDGLLKAMKECAVDCEMNAQDNTDVDACFSFEGTSTQYTFVPNLLEDINETGTDRLAAKAEVKSVMAPAKSVAEETGRLVTGPAGIGGPATATLGGPTTLGAATRQRSVRTMPGPDGAKAEFIFDPDTKNPVLYNLYAKTDRRLETKLGTIEENPATGKFKKPVWLAVGAAAPAGGAGAK